MRARLLVLAILASMVGAQDQETRRPRVLLLGDSIYGGPAQRAREIFGQRVELVVPKERPGDTTTALGRLDSLLGKGPWDLIHFNFGLADLHYRDPRSTSIRAMSKHAGGVRVTSPARYEENLRAIVRRLRKTGAKLLWASTTPIDPSNMDSLYDPGSEVEYNAIAARVMADNDIPINDMHGWVRATITNRRRANPFSFDRKPLYPPIVRRIVEVLDIQRPVKSPVRVFVMVGGWTHIGEGAVIGRDGPRAGTPRGTLDHLVLDPSTAEAHRHLVTPEGRWATRSDVWVQFDRRFTSSGALGVRFGGDRKRGIGPELGFGQILGDHFEEQVLILKTALGTPSLVRDLRPAGERPAGKTYDRLIQQVRDGLANLTNRFPDYLEESSHLLSGLIINLGEQDDDAAQYGRLLPRLIVSLRRDLARSALPVVIVGTGIGGRESDRFAHIIAAQQAAAALPRFAGTIAFVDTRDFWPAKDARAAQHNAAPDRWYHNAASFHRMGVAIGDAMTALLR